MCRKLAARLDGAEALVVEIVRQTVAPNFRQSRLSDRQLLGVSRYIALNPVRAGLCARPEVWPWSSYRATIGLEEAPPWLAIGALLSLYGTDRGLAAIEYRRLVEAELRDYLETRSPARPGTWLSDKSVHQVGGQVRGPGPAADSGG